MRFRSQTAPVTRPGAPDKALTGRGRSGRRAWRGALALGSLLLAGMWGEALAQSGPAVPAGQGQVLEARPSRSQDGRRVDITYAVQLTGAPLRPGMLLAVSRPTQYGRAEGPPYLQVGWVRVLATAEGVAIARGLPVPGGDKDILSPPVPIVSDILRPEASLKQVAPGGAGMELNRLFPTGNAIAAPDAGALINELSKTVSNTDQVLAIVYYGGGPTPEAMAMAWEQVQWVADQAARQLGLDETALHPVIMPLPPDITQPRAELRPLPSRGREEGRRGDPRREAARPPPAEKPAPEKGAGKPGEKG